MRRINVYPARSGWVWELWIGARIVLLGWCETRERAEVKARLA